MVNKKIKPVRLLIFIALCFYTIIQLYPLLWLVFFSLKDNKQIFTENALGLPDPAVIENYIMALRTGNVGLYLLNSLIVTGAAILITVILSAMASFAIARMKWKYSGVFLIFVTMGMMIPVHASLLPLFLSFSKMHILNTRISLILPYVGFALAFATNIMVLHFKTIPYELEEAAVIDGCSIYQDFFYLMIPMVKPAVVTVAIFTYLSTWNELMFANTFINEGAKKTLTVGIMSMVGQYSTNWGPIGAGLVIATIPSIIGYIFISNKLPDAISAGAVKG